MLDPPESSAVGAASAAVSAPVCAQHALTAVDEYACVQLSRLRLRHAGGERYAVALRHPADDAIGDGRAVAAHPGQHQQELVSADARGDVAVARLLAQHVGDPAQHQVAGGMPVAVVHRPEAVQVEGYDRQLAAAGVGRDQARLQLLVQSTMAEQAGQLIVQHLLADALMQLRASHGHRGLAGDRLAEGDVMRRPALVALVVDHLDQSHRARLDHQRQRDPGLPAPLVQLVAHALVPARVVAAVLAVGTAFGQQGAAVRPVFQHILLTSLILGDAGAELVDGHDRELVAARVPGRDRALAGALRGQHQMLGQQVGYPGHGRRARQLHGQAMKHLKLTAVAVALCEPARHADSLYVRLPARLASSRERSARAITSSGSVSPGSAMVMPSEAPAPALDVMAASTRRPTSAISSPTPGRISANSSPPRRPATSLWRAQQRIAEATSTSVLSPARWPRESFRALKLSRSSVITPTRVPSRWARLSSWPRRW